MQLNEAGSYHWTLDSWILVFDPGAACIQETSLFPFFFFFYLSPFGWQLLGYAKNGTFYFHAWKKNPNHDMNG